MKTNELITFLTKDLKKTNLLRSPFQRLLIWISINSVFLSVFIGLQTAMFRPIHIPNSVPTFTLLSIIFFVASWVIWKRNVPDLHSKWDLLWPTLLIILWLGSITFQLFSGGFESFQISVERHTSYIDIACVTRISLMAMFSSFVLISQIKAGYYEKKSIPIVLLTMLPFIVGEWGIYFLCPNESAGHIMLWHILIVIPVFGLGYAVIKYFLNRI